MSSATRVEFADAPSEWLTGRQNGLIRRIETTAELLGDAIRGARGDLTSALDRMAEGRMPGYVMSGAVLGSSAQKVDEYAVALKTLVEQGHLLELSDEQWVQVEDAIKGARR